MPITERQLNRRRTKLGSSDIPAILGLTPEWKTAEDVRLEKLGRLEVEEDAGDNDPRSLGRVLEEPVLSWAERKLGCQIHRNQYRVGPEPLAAHIDGLTKPGQEAVEAKTVGIMWPPKDRDQWGEPGTDEVPLKVIAQSMVHIICAKTDVCHVPALIAGRGYQMYEIGRDEDIARHIIYTAEQWWERHVMYDEPCVDMPSLPTLKRLRRRQGASVVVPADLIRRYERLKGAKSKVDAKVKESERALLDSLGDAEIGYNPEYPDKHFAYSKQTRKGYEVKPSTFRVARIKKGLPENE